MDRNYFFRIPLVVGSKIGHTENPNMQEKVLIDNIKARAEVQIEIFISTEEYYSNGFFYFPLSKILTFTIEQQKTYSCH